MGGYKQNHWSGQLDYSLLIVYIFVTNLSPFSFSKVKTFFCEIWTHRATKQQQHRRPTGISSFRTRNGAQMTIIARQTVELNLQQDRQCTNNVILRRVRATIVAAEKQ